MSFALYIVTLTTHASTKGINKFSVKNTLKWYEKVKMTEMTEVVAYPVTFVDVESSLKKRVF